MIRTQPNHQATKASIHNPDQTERLLRQRTQELPLSAVPTPALMATLRERSSAANKITLDCKVTKVNVCWGDEGGIVCQLTFDEEKKTEVFVVSITHLAFDLRPPGGARDSGLPELSHQAHPP